MQIMGKPRDHFWRVIKMAKACEVDLSTALDEGAIDVEFYADMINGCRGCTQVGKCDRKLADMPTLEEAPEYCVNRETFARLRSA